MNRSYWRSAVVVALIALLPGVASAITREIAEFERTRLSFDRSVINQLTFDTYRDPFDELQTRPYNLLFTNIGRHSNLSPWQGQEGSYSKYLNALIGNNGAANVDNDADAIQGSFIRRQSDAWSWGGAAAFLAGTNGSDDSSGTLTFVNTDDLSGFDLRGAVARQLSERRVIGGGFRLTQASAEDSLESFDAGVGGFFGSEEFEQAGLALDVGLRTFRNPSASWEVQVVLGVGSAEQSEFSENLDDTGAITDRFVDTNYEVSDLGLGVYGGYNRLRRERPGETEFRVGVELSQRELDNDDLSFSESGGVVTPLVTLTGQDTISTTSVIASAKTIFKAGQTEMFVGGQLGFSTVTGSTTIDAGGPLTEEVDDSVARLGGTVGLRQPLFRDKLRFIVSGRADLLSQDTSTIFDTASDGDDSSQTVAQYAIGLETVLANVTLDLAWLAGEEAPVQPVPFGLPQGSRRSVELDRLIFSAGVSW